jgi:hypothetical protein
MIGGLQPSWTYCLHGTLLGLVAQLLTILIVDLKIWWEGVPPSEFFNELKQVRFG